MKPEPCQVWLNGWRLAVVVRGRRWARVWTFQRRPQRVAAAELLTRPVDAETAERLAGLFRADERSLRSVIGGGER